ncbi:MAG: 23S rRNA (adenine(2503)-C(2))-methyltransferase RlmN, partial [Thermoleophilia bacterium]|nr:23S rRNA (adenine(2503)-C(2))-methyltransferase RlmN [Thermoleophilia bacterium]
MPPTAPPTHDDSAPRPVVETRQDSADDGTIKLRLRTCDGHPLEAVLMRFVRGGGGAAGGALPPRYTACLSSQSGCALSCTFCATGRMKLGRSLTRGEIVAQFDELAAIAPTRIDNVVMMGMGEPFHNYDEVLAALRALADQRGHAIAPRRMTISTVGWVPGIERFAADDFPARLALSLHASSDAVRAQLMPVNRRFPLARLMQACADYCDATGRSIFIEYLLLAGVNDSLAQARELADLLATVHARASFHVNLIAYNPAGTPYVGSGTDVVHAFRDALRERGLETSYRVSRGRDIAG